MVCRTKRYIKEIFYTHQNIKPEKSILMKTELESRSKEVSDHTIITNSIKHLRMRKVKHKKESGGIFQTRDMCSARKQGREGEIHVVKRLNM